MILKHRIDLLSRLGVYMLGDETLWIEAKQKAYLENAWFIPEFVELAIKNIAENFLKNNKLTEWTAHYNFHADRYADSKLAPLSVGIVMAGNIPLVGFHDFLSVLVSGHKAIIKPSSKDKALINHLVGILINWEPKIAKWVSFSDMLKGCDAYIATGSNNTSRYFEYYFANYPHIIRRNKTSVAVLNGTEPPAELVKLADDVYQFFGLGCRNVTKIYVPAEYNFESLLTAFEKYNYVADHHKYKNNYDYNLAIQILNNKFYMTNGSVLLIEDASIFSPISQVNYEYYDNKAGLLSSLYDNQDIQIIMEHDHIPFGQAQAPGLFDYADKTDTMAFLHSV